MDPLKARLAWLPALLILAGCVEPSPASCEGPDCRGASPTPGLGSFGFWETNETVQFAGCRGGVANLDVPLGPVRDLVPPAFQVTGRTSGTALLLLRSLHCDRIAANATVFEDAWIQKLVAFVAPTDRSWALDGTHVYVIGILASDERLSEFLSHGVPVEPAAFALSELPAGPLVTESWKVRSAGCTFDYQFERSGQGRSLMSGVFHHWFGAEPVRRMEVRENFQYDAQVGAGTARVEGSCEGARATGPAVGYASLAYTTMESAWLRIPQTYPSEDDNA